MRGDDENVKERCTLDTVTKRKLFVNSSIINDPVCGRECNFSTMFPYVSFYVFVSRDVTVQIITSNVVDFVPNLATALNKHFSKTRKFMRRNENEKCDDKSMRCAF